MSPRFAFFSLFRMRVPPLIETPDDLKTELDLMKALEDIETAFSIIKTEKKSQEINPADKHYQGLQCDLKPIPAGDKMDKVSVVYSSRWPSRTFLNSHNNILLYFRGLTA